MKTQKGYILPIILIVLLLGLAGFFLFTSQPVESPVVEDTPVMATTTTTTTSISNDINNEDIGGEEIVSTSTASTTIDLDVSVSNQCTTDEDCLGSEICYFKPGGTIGSCTEL